MTANILCDNIKCMKVLKFGAPWCMGCIVMGPRWKEIEEENKWLETEYFNYDESGDTVKKYRVENGRLPTFIFLDKNENEILRLSGEIPKEKLLQIINSNADK